MELNELKNTETQACNTYRTKGRNLEIDCLRVNKEYDACQQRECIENILFKLDIPTDCEGDLEFVRCEFGRAKCEKVPETPEFTEVNESFARLRTFCAIPVYVVLRKSNNELVRVRAYPVFDETIQEDNKIRFFKDIVVYAPVEFLRQERFECCCESYAECDESSIIYNGKKDIVLTIGVFLIVKVISEVELCIPTFGFCDVPAPCEEFPEAEVFCEVFLDEELTPFPEFFPRQQHQLE